jgi:fructokinase
MDFKKRKLLMLLAIGEVLFDIFPNYTRLGGAPFNFHYHLAGMQRKSALLSRVGDDDERSWTFSIETV